MGTLRTGRAAVAVMLTSSLLAAACGSSNKAGDTTVVAGTDTTLVAPVTGAAGDTTMAGTDTSSMADTSTSAVGAMDTTVPGTSATTTGMNGAGAGGSTVPSSMSLAGLGKQADGTYKGAGGFSIDLSKCPKDYDVHQGISATEVRAFLSIPKSGPFAGFGLIADGMNSYFKYINDNGGVAGHQIVLDSKDDLYQADKTKANVTEAISSGKYAALVGTLGTPNNLAVWDDTNKECMPQLLNATGAPQWGDVDGHPLTTGMQLDYTTEAILWAEFIKQKFPNGAKVGMLTYNSDFGLSYSKGFRKAVEGSDIKVVKEEFHEASAPNLTNQFTNLSAAKPDVVLIQTSGAFCTQAMAELEKRGYTGMTIISATCASLSQFFQPLIAQNLTGKDVYVLQYVKDINDPEFADDAFVKLLRTTLTAQGLDPKQSTYATGWLFAWYYVEMLKMAAALPGGLDRANLMIAARSIDEKNPLTLDGVTNKMAGFDDAYLNESARMAQYQVTDPKQLGTFKAVGDVINKEGALGTYKKFKEQTGG